MDTGVRPEESAATILLVDDDTNVLKMMVRCLRRSGFRLIDTNFPERAVEILAEQPVDVLVSDIDMPGMNGLELVGHARRVRPHVARILVTGAGTLDAAVRAINEGEVHRFLRKPFEQRKFRQAIEEAVQRRDELRRRSEAGRLTEIRQAFVAQLEAEHPGITAVPREADGSYAVKEGTRLLEEFLRDCKVL